MATLGGEGPSRYFHCLWNPGCRFKRRISRWNVADEQVAECISLEDALKVADQYSVNLMRSRFNRHFNERHSNETMPDWLKLPRKVAAKSPEEKTAKKAVQRKEAKLAAQPAAVLANESAKHGRSGGAAINAALYGGGAGVRIRDPTVSAGGPVAKKRKAEAAPQPEPFAASAQGSARATAAMAGGAVAGKRSTSDPARVLPLEHEAEGEEVEPPAAAAASHPPVEPTLLAQTSPAAPPSEKRRCINPVTAAASAAIGAVRYMFGLSASES